MKLETIEQIDSKMQEIKAMLREDDAYYVSDAIISNVDDPDLLELVEEMMATQGYTADKIAEVSDVVKKIQSLINESED